MTIINIAPSADTYVNSYAATTNYGTAIQMNVGMLHHALAADELKELLMRFPLTAIPTGATITSAKLYLTYLTASGGLNTNIISNIPTANRTWTETGVTWNNKPAYDNTYPSKTFVESSSQGIDITSYVKDMYNQGIAAEFDIHWASGNGGFAGYGTKEHTTVANRPYLQVTYTFNKRIYVNSEDPIAFPSWNYESFPGFMYDLHTNAAPETLSINNIMDNLNNGRTISAGQLTYSTGRASVYFPISLAMGLTVNGASTYPAVGWKGEKWIAINNKVNKIARLVLEQRFSASEKKTVQTNEVWNLGAGYTLTATNINATSTPRQITFILARNGVTLDTKTVAQGAQYTFTQTVLGEANQTVFSTYVDSIFAGATSNMAQFRYTWLIDAGSALTIAVGNVIDVFTVGTATVDSIVMSNTSAISLSGANTQTKIFGATLYNIYLITNVATGQDLEIYPDIKYIFAGPTAMYETRGYTYSSLSDNINTMPHWDAQSFAGFLYDFPNRVVRESLAIGTPISTLQSTMNIGVGGMTYITTKFNRNFKIYNDKALTVNGQSTYPVIGWQGTVNIPANGKVDILMPLVLEMGSNDEKTVVVGELWDMGSGYTLKIAAADSSSALVQLSYNGVQIDQNVVAVGNLYTYIQTVGTETNVLTCAVYVDAIFAGQTTSLIRLKYAWLASAGYTQIRSSDQYGVMGNASINNTTGTLTLMNIYGMSIYPSGEDYYVSIMGNLAFKIANIAPTLRFYLYTSNYIFPVVNIVATNMTVSSSCLEPCDVTINWKNTGEMTGSFTPRMILDGPSKVLIEYIDPSTNLPEIVPMLPNDIITRTLKLTGIASGNYNVCPNPN